MTRKVSAPLRSASLCYSCDFLVFLPFARVVPALLDFVKVGVSFFSFFAEVSFPITTPS